jgi:hypothetical protein
LAGRPGGSLAARLTLRPLRTDGSLRTGGADLPAFASGTLRSDWPLRSLRTLRSGRTNGAGLAGRARGALWPRLRLAACSDRKCRKDGGDDHTSSHRQAPEWEGSLHRSPDDGQQRNQTAQASGRGSPRRSGCAISTSTHPQSSSTGRARPMPQRNEWLALRRSVPSVQRPSLLRTGIQDISGRSQGRARHAASQSQAQNVELASQGSTTAYR